MLENENHRIAVIGAGPAGISAAVTAAELGIDVDWYDKADQIGGKLNDYYQLFPDRTSAMNVLQEFDNLTGTARIHKHFGKAINHIEKNNGRLVLMSDHETVGSADSVIVATGFDFFDARNKEEFGYGMYNQVITSPELEQKLKTNPDSLKFDGEAPANIAFVHCVGSRDQQIGINYCSRLCCVTGIKQAIEMRELFPSCRVVNFYIDLRAFGSGYEELYREAQEKHQVQFIRGRVSEASENQQHRIVLKAEDTLMGRPLKITVDWVVLLIGMVPSCTQVQVADHQCTDQETGFLKAANAFTGHRLDGQPGIFMAGACGGPMSIPEAAASGKAAATEALQYLINR